MDYKVIDNFLPEEDFKVIQELIVFNERFPFFLNSGVTYEETTDRVWDWYGTHLFYGVDRPTSAFYEDVRKTFLPKIEDAVGEFKALLRIKANFYPNTPVLQEHLPHADYDWSNQGAIFSLNTCDGFTRLGDSIKIDSVANRLLIFDASLQHNSTTTTTERGRFNINFNWL